MRLSEDQRKTIHHTARELFGDCTVYLFGSRVDDAARGGDIDLLVETPRPVENRAAMAARYTARLQTGTGCTGSAAKPSRPSRCAPVGACLQANKTGRACTWIRVSLSWEAWTRPRIPTRLRPLASG